MTAAEPGDADVAASEVTLADLLAELTAIRTLLEQSAEATATCPHGATGLCMNCLTPQIDYHLTQMVQQVGNQVWESLRKR